MAGDHNPSPKQSLLKLIADAELRIGVFQGRGLGAFCLTILLLVLLLCTDWSLAEVIKSLPSTDPDMQ